MKNLNTVKFWDKQFKDEYEAFINDNDTNMIRYNFERFELVSSFVPIGAKVLDLGCGLGHFCRYLKARIPSVEVSGTDMSGYAVEKAKEIAPDIKFFKSEKNKISGTKKYDVIVMQEVLEHSAFHRKLVKMCMERLKKNGQLIITTPIFGAVVKGTLSSHEHLFEYEPHELIDFMKEYSDNFYLLLPPEKITPTQKLHTYWQLGVIKKGKEAIKFRNTLY